jgi:hypothetical protein
VKEALDSTRITHPVSGATLCSVMFIEKCCTPFCVVDYKHGLEVFFYLCLYLSSSWMILILPTFILSLHYCILSSSFA